MHTASFLSSLDVLSIGSMKLNVESELSVDSVFVLALVDEGYIPRVIWKSTSEEVVHGDQGSSP